MAMLKEWGDDTTGPRARATWPGLIASSWESAGGDVTARTTYEWAPSKISSSRGYAHAENRDKPMIGTQVIGVDPASGAMRSWTFDADGGIRRSDLDVGRRPLGNRFGRHLADGRAPPASTS